MSHQCERRIRIRQYFSAHPDERWEIEEKARERVKHSMIALRDNLSEGSPIFQALWEGEVLKLIEG